MDRQIGSIFTVWYLFAFLFKTFLQTFLKDKYEKIPKTSTRLHNFQQTKRLF